MTDHPVVDSATAPNNLRERNAIRYTIWCTGLLVGVSCTVTLSSIPSKYAPALVAEWPVWMLILQTLAVGTIVRIFGLPRSLRNRIVFGSANTVLVGTAVLEMLQLLEFVLIRVLEIVLRLAIVGLWGLAVLGCVPVLVWIVRRRSRARRKGSRLAKCWFAGVMILLTAEPLAFFIDWQEHRLAFPTLTRTPPENELHVVSLGGSTMAGHPYNPKFGIPNVYAWRLQHVYPDRKVVMHNIAKEQINLSRAIKRLELLEFRPHHLLLYSGHNEFYHDMEELVLTSNNPFLWIDRWLAYSPAFGLISRPLAERVAVRAQSGEFHRDLIDRPIAGPIMHRRRLKRFRSQLEQLAEFCRQNDITSQWFIPIGSESVFEPNRSTVHAGTSESEKEALRKMYRQAKDLEAQGKYSEAADIYRQGLSGQSKFAEFHFRLADCLSQLKQYDEAQQHYILARDLDGHPVRTNADYRRTLAEVAEENGIPILDAADVLRPHTKHGILDRSMFHDKVHPTLHAFYLLGIAAAEQVFNNKQLEPRFVAATDVPPAQFEAAKRDLKITLADLVLAYKRTGYDLIHLSLYRFDETRRRREGAHYKKLAEQLEKGEIKPGEAGTEVLFAEPRRR